MLMRSFDTWADRTIIFVVGDVDPAEATTLYAETERAVSTGRPEIIVDLYNATHLDPAAIGALVRADEFARRHGRAFAVECARGQPAIALRRTALRRAAHTDRRRAVTGPAVRASPQ
jgi:anti-anti-sigma regulatory factor